MLKKSIILLVIALGVFLLVNILFLQKNDQRDVEEVSSEETDSEYSENKILENTQAGFRLMYPGSYTFVSDDTSIYSIGSLSRSDDRIDIVSNSFSNLYSQDSFRIYGSEDLEEGQTLSWGSFGEGSVECSYEVCEDYSDQFVVLLQLSSIKEGNLALSTTLYLSDGKNMHTLEDMMDTPVIQDMYAIAKSFELYEYQELFEGYEYLLVRDDQIYFKEHALNKILLEGANPQNFRSLDGKITQASYTKDFSDSYSPYTDRMAYFEGRYYVSGNYAWYLVEQEEYENRNIVALGAVNVSQLKSFSMPNDDRSGYVSDGARVFYLGQEFEAADVRKLRSLDRDYATDLKNVYFHTKRMPGADFASFKIDRVGNSNSHYAYDNKNLYFMQNRIGTSEGYEQISWRYRKNKDKVFYHYHACEGDEYGTHSEVEGADPESFNIFLEEVDQNYDYPEQPYIPYDKNYVYREDKPVFGSDPQSLRPLNVPGYIGAQDDNNNRYQYIRGSSSCS